MLVVGSPFLFFVRYQFECTDLVHLLVVDLTIYTLKKQSDNSSAGIILKPAQSLIYTVKWSLGVIMRCMINFCLYAWNWSILILFEHCTSVPGIQRTIHALFKVACFSFTVYSYIFNHRINMGLIGWRILCYTLREPRMAVITWTIFTRLMARCGFLSVFSKLHYFQHSLIWSAACSFLLFIINSLAAEVKFFLSHTEFKSCCCG